MVSIVTPFTGVEGAVPGMKPVCLRRGTELGGSRGVLKAEARVACDCACTSRTRKRSRSASI